MKKSPSRERPRGCSRTSQRFGYAAMRQRHVVWIATGEIGLADETDFVFRDR